MVGFFVYSSDTEGALNAAFRHHFGAFAWTLASSCLVRPGRFLLALRLIPLVLPRGPQPGSEIPAELISLAVEPAYRRSTAFFAQHGIDIAHELVAHALRVLAERDIRRVKVFTELDEANPMSNKFFRREGFDLHGAVKRFAFPCNLYFRDLR